MAFKPKTETERILHRLKIAQGHLGKVIQMVESHSYCINVLHQSSAVQRQLKEADLLLLENHLNTCATDAIKKGNEVEAIKEIIEVLKRSNR